MDMKPGTLDPSAGSDRRERFERGDELGTTIRVPGVVKSIDADYQVARVEDFSPPEREGEKHRVAGRDVRRRNLVAMEISIARNFHIRCQRRPPDGTQINLELQMTRDAKRVRHLASRLDFPRVALTVGHSQRVQLEPLRRDDGRRRV